MKKTIVLVCLALHNTPLYTHHMLVDGKSIANALLEEVREAVAGRAEPAPLLSALTCSPNFETRRYLEMKRKKALSVGINLNVVELPAETTTAESVVAVLRLAEEADGVVVQLPFPKTVDREALLSVVPVGKDPDGFSYGLTDGACLPPVVGAIDEISKRYEVVWDGRKVVILGEGRLVGQPAMVYARARNADVVTLNESTYDKSYLQTADIIISGIGRPHFITPELIKEGTIIFDAGTAEDGGVLAGDVQVGVGSKASLLTPVPGGIGPITIAYLFKNLVTLKARRSMVQYHLI